MDYKSVVPSGKMVISWTENGDSMDDEWELKGISWDLAGFNGGLMVMPWRFNGVFIVM